MKKAIIIIISAMLPILAWGQAQINTKKVKIGDFTRKITKVVLSGNDFLDSSLREEVTGRWRVSPYEFCTLEEFNTLKGSEEYYFLITTSGQFKKESEPSLQFLTLVKGGSGAEKGIDGMLEVVSLPIASAKYPSGREIIFLPAFLDIIQNYVLDSMNNDFNAYGGLSNYTKNLSKADNMQIAFSENDICGDLTDMDMKMLFNDEMFVTDEDEADSYLLDNAENTLVSYIAAPTDAHPGAFCYKMLIDTQNHKLYYFKKHRITKSAGACFLKNDLKRIHSIQTR